MLASKDSAEARLDRSVGVFVGLAVGDALGAAVEFSAPGSFEPVTDLRGGGPFGLEAGQWTDDTSMALCLAESLLDSKGFDGVDQLKRYVRWWRTGYWSSTGRCFDIGIQTRTALEEFERTGNARCGPTGLRSAGNGSLMRLGPIAIAYHSDASTAIEKAAESSRTTHGNEECVDACRYFAGLLAAAINGATKHELIGSRSSPASGEWWQGQLCEKVRSVAEGSFFRKEPPAIRGRGYVVDALEAALWAFATTESYRDAVLAAVNLGDDADTTGAICGQLAGAFYGQRGIPLQWRIALTRHEEIQRVAARLFVMAGDG